MIGKPIYPASTTPKLAPIANNGVTSPPLNPIAVQRAVNISFNIKSQLSTKPFSSESSIKFVPNEL